MMDEKNLNESDFAKDDLQKLFSLLHKYNLKKTEELLKQEAKVSDKFIHEFKVDSDISYSLTEQYSKLCKFVDNCLLIHKAELSVLLYPVFVHIYLHLLSLEQYVQAKDFFKIFVKCQEKMYHEDLIMLQEFSNDNRTNTNSIYEIFNTNQFSLRICRLSFAYFKKVFLDDKCMIDLANVVNQRLIIDIYEGVPRSEAEINLLRGAFYGESLSDKNSKPILYGNLNDPLLDFVVRRKAELENECGDGDARAKKKVRKDSPLKFSSASRKMDSISPSMTNIPLPTLSANDLKIIRQMYAEINTLPRLRRKRRLFDEDIGQRDNVLPIDHHHVDKQRFMSEGIPLNSVMYTMGNLNCQGTSAAFSEDCSMLAVGLSSGVLHVRCLGVGPLTRMRPPEELDDLSLGDKDIHTRMMTNSSGANYEELRGHAGGVYDVCWSTDGQQILSASADGTVRLWSTQTWTNIAKYRDQGEPLWAVDIAPVYGQYIATGGNDRCVALFNGDYLKPLRRFVGDSYGAVTCVKIHGNVNYVASGSTDRVVRLFDVRSGGMVRSFTGHKGIVNCVRFSDDGRYLLSGCDAGSVNVWDLAVPSTLVDTLNVTGGRDNTGGPVTSLAFCRDGAVLAVGRQAGQVDLWNYSKVIKTNNTDGAVEKPAEEVEDFGMPGKRAHPLDCIIDILYTKKTPIIGLQFNRRNMLSCCGIFNQI